MEPSNNGQTVLPEKLIAIPDIYNDEMDSPTGWAKGGTDAVLTLNTTHVKSSTGSLRLTSGSGISAYIHKQITPLDLSTTNKKSFKIWVYFHSDPAITISDFSVFAYSGTEYADKFYTIAPNLSNWVQNQWNFLEFYLPFATDWKVDSGSPSWSNICRFMIKVTPKTGQKADVSFDKLTIGRTNTPAVIIKFDDGNMSDYIYSYPLLKAKNMVATSYIVSDLIGSNTCMTTENIKELNNNGWAIANHAKSHSYMTLLTEQQVYDEFNNCQIFLDGLGLTKSSKDITVPGGATNSAILAALALWGERTKILGDNGYTNRYEVEFPSNINAFGIQNNETVAQVKTYIDLAISKGEVAVLQLHQLVESNADASTKWLVSQFTEILDYIESLSLQTLTIDEYYRLHSESITVNHK